MNTDVRLEDYFPVWSRLSAAEQNMLKSSAQMRHVTKGTLLHNGSTGCEGLFLIVFGQLRAYLSSEEGREITVYRLFERDICLFSASCMMQSIQFEITIEAEKDAQLLIIPASVYRRLMDTSLPVANFTNELMANHFSEVMWLMEQIMWKSFDKRLAAFLLDESSLEQTETLKITHERIAAHLGTAREVVTRMLRYFQSENMVRLSRGTIELTDTKKLQELTL